ncbi:MAG: class I SAM-dependent methyltransferase [Halobacteriota archaeon]
MHGPGDVRFFDRFATLYDFFMPAAKAETLRAGLSLADRPVERVLDVGGGTGRATVTLDADERVVVDVARGMLRRAQRRARGLDCVQGDATRLPVADESVDAVVVVDAFHHMPNQSVVIDEAARVLAPGGALVIREFNPATLLGRGLVLAERVVGFDSTFYTPETLASAVGERGLDPAVVDTGFGYTVVGVKRSSL